MMAVATDMTLMSLPVEMIDKILSYLSYDQVSRLRSVNRMFNCICSDRLNKGFLQVEQFHSRCLKAVKSQLPRRESERKHHPLSRHSDILMAVETRLSMLSMTYTKYIEEKHCCFIPGKVLDEALRVLRIVSMYMRCCTLVENTPVLPRPHDFLQEYRDVSSMAMEHFDDKILPNIREKIKLKNPRVYCFKRRPDENNAADKGVNQQVMRLLKNFRNTKLKCYSARKSVIALHRNVQSISNRWKTQSILMKRKLNQQGAVIKLMRRELKETRAAMSTMSKDINRLKIEQSSARDQNSSDRPMCSNLSVTVTSSLSLPATDEPSSSDSGIKKRESPEATAVSIRKKRSLQNEEDTLKRHKKIYKTSDQKLF